MQLVGWCLSPNNRNIRLRRRIDDYEAVCFCFICPYMEEPDLYSRSDRESVVLVFEEHHRAFLGLLASLERCWIANRVLGGSGIDIGIFEQADGKLLHQDALGCLPHASLRNLAIFLCF